MRLLPAWCAVIMAVTACADSTPPLPRPADPLLPDASRVVGIAMAYMSTCALTADGKAHCWGENRFGEFGNGTVAGSSEPLSGGGGLAFDLLSGSMGTPQMCGVARDRSTYCWGYNLNGELGDGTSVNRSRPVRVDAAIAFRALTSSYHTCGVSVDGTAYCWGDGLGGQLGTGSGASSLRPARVQTTDVFSSITNGMQFSCALTLQGGARCWGWGAGLGSGPADRSVNVPTPVSGGHVFRSISAGEEHACAATTGGQVYCWGKMSYFYPEGFWPTPLPVAVDASIVTVASGYGFNVSAASCGLTGDGDAYCWFGGREAKPVPGAYRFAGLTGGYGRFCGHTPGGAALCWTWIQEPGSETSWVPEMPRAIPSL